MDKTIEINNYTMISDYLSQAHEILLDQLYSFECSEIDLLDNIPTNDIPEWKRQLFFYELSKATEPIKMLVNEMSSILEGIYAIKHPLKHKYNTLKKNIYLQILSVIEKVTSFFKNGKGNGTTFLQKKESIVSGKEFVIMQ